MYMLYFEGYYITFVEMETDFVFQNIRQLTSLFETNSAYFQLVVERMLATEGIKRSELGRDEFTNRVWEWKEKYNYLLMSQAYCL